MEIMGIEIKKENVRMQLRKEAASDRVSIPWNGLAITFSFPLVETEDERSAVIVNTKVLEELDVTAEELFELAKENMAKNDSPIVGDFFGMKVLTNKSNLMGATTILYEDGLVKTIAEQCYLIPSSVHEWIILPEDGYHNPTELVKIIREVNSTVVEDKDVLSDDLFYYDNGKVSKVA